MLDARVRPWIDPPLNAMGRWLARQGISADHVTVAGCALGLAGAMAVALGAIGLGLLLFLSGRLFDGLDGAVARATKPTDRGGFLDIVLDFALYATFPLAFAVLDPAQNALPAAALLASFLLNGAAFLAFAVMAERHRLETSAQGIKSLYYLMGIAEGSEMIAVFTAFCILPAWFPQIAFGFAAVCLASGLARIVYAWRALG